MSDTLEAQVCFDPTIDIGAGLSTNPVQQTNFQFSGSVNLTFQGLAVGGQDYIVLEAFSVEIIQ